MCEIAQCIPYTRRVRITMYPPYRFEKIQVMEYNSDLIIYGNEVTHNG